MKDWFDRFLHVVFGMLLILSFLFFQRYHQEKKQRERPQPPFLQIGRSECGYDQVLP